jgi:hypothetical protein
VLAAADRLEREIIQANLGEGERIPSAQGRAGLAEKN